MHYALAAFGLFLLLLSSCADKADQSDLRGESARAEHQSLEGSLEENVLKIQNNYFAENCDKKIRDIQLEIARELDRRQNEIAALPPKENNVGSTQYVRKQLGPITIREITPGTPPKPTAGWVTRKDSWQEIIQDYQAIKSTPTDSNWRELNTDARSILSDDVDRVVYLDNYYLDKDSEPAILLLKAELEKCEANENCVAPNLAASETFLQTQPNYQYYVTHLKSNPDAEERRSLVKRFLKNVNYGAQNTNSEKTTP